MVQREFPTQAAEWIDPVSRRGFLKVMGASLALAGLSGCTKQPDEPIYPYVKEPEDLVLGRPVYFATAMPFNTGAVPLLVKSDAYRPIKLDGNPDHPVNRGSSDPLTQGSLLDLYDPDRSQRVICRGEVRAVCGFSCRVPRHVGRQEGKRGRRALHPERHRDLSHPGSAMEGGAAELPQCQVAAVGPGQSRFGLFGFEDCFRRLLRRPVSPAGCGCNCLSRRGLSFRHHPSGISSLSGRLRQPAEAGRRQAPP